MQIYSGFISAREFTNKAKVSHNLLYELKDVTIYKMGRISIIKKCELPLKYKEAANSCYDLGEYWGYSFFSNTLGSYNNYLTMQELNNKKSFEHIKIGKLKFIKLSKEFLKAIKEGDTPFVINDDFDKECAEYIINMQGLKIGFY